ncbi:Hsp70 family protein [Enterococcus sp. 669A]|uniref:Hsp70 family protein n=1 Tax=Candidatus Enterococcus moelleringii TaxID=2815325 RepID=A0ABS3L9K6_9ENTE|nr:Hsp70 family protein [Enterococcus sp. 669A]MBO1306309.1 Hsp70 family protein [Enterococcus sp. 669A]
MKIGIDFGTSFSMPAVVVNGAPRTLLPNGEYAIPSVFYYDTEVGVQIGKAAEDNADFQPLNVKRDIKMELSTNCAAFVADGMTFSAKQIINYIFEEIRKVSLNESKRRELVSQKIDGAVISVPVAFTLRELNLIREAAESPNSDGKDVLNVLGFIREPVAAAISYFNAPNSEDNKTILVYDLGGGTCDVAIVRSSKNASEWYTVIDSDMDRIGGREWDKALIKLIKQKYQEKTGHLDFDAEMENKILKQAINVKHILSDQRVARASVTLSGKTYSCVITVEEFERATANILQSTMQLVNKLIEKCNVPIDYIVCVGGSSNMPQIRKNFESSYPEIPVKLYEPEKAIAYGAAIYAEHLTEKNFLSDICKFSYGALYLDSLSRYQGKKREIINNIIYKGTQLPASSESTSYHIRSGRYTIELPIYESEKTERIYLPTEGTHIGDILIECSENSKESDATLLKMAIDPNGLMTLNAIEVRTGDQVTAEIRLNDF